MSSQQSDIVIAATEARLTNNARSKSKGTLQTGGDGALAQGNTSAVDDNFDDDIPYDEKFMREEGPTVELWLTTPHIFSKTGDRKIHVWAENVVDWNTQKKLGKLSDLEYREVFQYISEQLTKVESENLDANGKTPLLEGDVEDIRKMVLRKFCH